MAAIRFDIIGQSLSRIPDVIRSIPDVIRNPSGNPLEAALLLAILLIVIVMLLLMVILVVMRPPREIRSAEAGKAEARGSQRRPRSRTTIAALVVLLAAVLGVASGVTTASSQVCASCHQDSPHAAAALSDPHREVQCVRCHEGGGAVARASGNLIPRIEHFVLGASNPKAARGYGRQVASDSCVACHAPQISGVAVDSASGVRVSHKEPLAAGGECVDCHRLRSGIVTKNTIGMAPCLRCHDGTKAAAACATCHTGDPARTVGSTLPSGTALAQPLVPNPQCGSCHSDMRKCDSCHGLRMPHTADFKAYGHARQGALDIWNNGGRTCGKCHYQGHNSCDQAGCHQATFPQHGLTWKAFHKAASWSASDAGCSCHQWNSRQHGGMVFCQVCHATKPANARP